ncbi:hypothetical protein JTB14_029176 [Gonioctena quinquepunctata]|nr:hypothetical protein JTB14_029176 [Gonioctena quinquepunctata]
MITFSKDLDENNQNYLNLTAIFDFSEFSEDISLYDFVKLTNPENQTTYLLIAKKYDFEKIKYNITSLKNIGKHSLENNIDKIYMQNPVESNANLKQDLMNEMLEFLFSKFDREVKFVNKQKLQPETKHEIKRIFIESHASSVSEHLGYLRTYIRIKENYKRPGRAIMEITTTSEKPFKKLAIDVVGPLPMTFNGNKFIITMQDGLTEFSFVKATPNHEAETVANSLLEFITIFGIAESKEAILHPI